MFSSFRYSYGITITFTQVYMTHRKMTNWCQFDLGEMTLKEYSTLYRTGASPPVACKDNLEGVLNPLPKIESTCFNPR